MDTPVTHMQGYLATVAWIRERDFVVEGRARLIPPLGKLELGVAGRNSGGYMFRVMKGPEAGKCLSQGAHPNAIPCNVDGFGEMDRMWARDQPNGAAVPSYVFSRSGMFDTRLEFPYPLLEFGGSTIESDETILCRPRWAGGNCNLLDISVSEDVLEIGCACMHWM